MTDTGNLGRYSWHELMTTDLSAAGRFYETVVGWKATKSDMGGMPDSYVVFMDGERPAAGMMGTPPDSHGMPPAWLAYIQVADVDRTIAHATTLGASLLAPATTVAGVGRFAVLKDPQGAAFGVLAPERESPPETDPRTREFSWHELATTDWKDASVFYSALFGWKMQSEMDMGPMGTYWMYGRDRFTYGGMMNRSPEMPPPYWLHYVSVDSADAAVERAKGVGGTLLRGPMDVPGGDRIAILTDPQGAAFAVHSRPAG